MAEGVIVVPAVRDTTKTKCVMTKCLDSLVPLHLMDEAEDTIAYSGACSLCGKEYTLLIMKEKP